MYKIMTPGPTQVRENVRRARSMETTNPDLDLKFYEDYRRTCLMISKLLHTEKETFILSGEGILGLEAACASLTEPSDRVLVLDNGIFGRGFADFVRLYGGTPVLYTADYENALDAAALEKYLERDHAFKYATVVHCDTPSGVLNDVSVICPLLKKFGILTVVDAVSAMFGEKLYVDEYGIDIVCGGSQKALSAPPGLTLVTVSDAAKRAMHGRTVPIASFYANILQLEDYYAKQWFPYTMPVSDILGLRIALENVNEDKQFQKRHQRIGEAFRAAVRISGLLLYLKSGYSNTVTVIRVPEGIRAADIIDTMRTRHNIMIAGCFDELEGKVFRIGHMGENANFVDMISVSEALDETFRFLGYPLKASLRKEFMKNFE